MATCQDLFKDKNISIEELQRLLFQSCRDGKRDVVDFILSKGVRLDVRDKDGRTPLTLSSMSGYEDVVTLILDHGVDVRNGDGSWALLEACENGHWKVVKTLAEHGGDINERDLYGKRALIRACMAGHDKVVEILIKSGSYLNERDDGGMTALMWACKKGHRTLVGMLLDHISDLNQRDNEGKTALMFACIEGHDSVVELLIEHVSNPNEKDNYGLTALMFACENGHVNVAEILIRNLSDANARDYSGKTALIWACMNGHDEVLKVLLKNVSDLNETDNAGESALMLACAHGHDKVLRLLIEHGAHVNVLHLNGYTPLIDACHRGNYTTVELLLKQGVDVNATDDHGLTSLMVACMNEWMIQQFQDSYVKTIRLLLEHGAEVDTQDVKHGWSAVMMAVRTGNEKCLQVLLSAGPNLDLVDKGGKTVFSHAVNELRMECLRILFEDGKLFTAGRLNPVHRNSIVNVSSQILTLTIEFGVFEWEWCPPSPFSVFKDISLSALKFGFSPGKIKLRSNRCVSPLIVSLMFHYTELTLIFLERLYYYPEDYKLLCTDVGLRKSIDSDIRNNILFEPQSLEKWCYLTVSKAISTSCFPVRRSDRVDALPIPDILKRRLKFIE